MTEVSTSELFLKDETLTKFRILLPNREEHIQSQQGRQQRLHDKSHVKLRELSLRDSLTVRNTRERIGEVGSRYSHKTGVTIDLFGKSWSPTALCSYRSPSADGACIL